MTWFQVALLVALPFAVLFAVKAMNYAIAHEQEEVEEVEYDRN